MLPALAASLQARNIHFVGVHCDPAVAQARLDGTDRNVSAGDMVLTRRGGSHSLVNTGNEPLRVLVICGRIGEAE
jgi:hypothetical protein